MNDDIKVYRSNKEYSLEGWRLDGEVRGIVTHHGYVIMKGTLNEAFTLWFNSFEGSVVKGVG